MGITFTGWREPPEGSYKISSGRFMTPYGRTFAKWELWLGPAGLIFYVREIHSGLKQTILILGNLATPGRGQRVGRAPPWAREEG